MRAYTGTVHETHTGNSDLDSDSELDEKWLQQLDIDINGCAPAVHSDAKMLYPSPKDIHDSEVIDLTAGQPE